MVMAAFAAAGRMMDPNYLFLEFAMQGGVGEDARNMRGEGLFREFSARGRLGEEATNVRDGREEGEEEMSEAERMWAWYLGEGRGRRRH